MYKVYWTDSDGQACSRDYSEMIEALTETNHLRAIGRAYVAMCSENPNRIGTMGVAGVEDGKLPTGEKYTWQKRRS